VRQFTSVPANKFQRRFFSAVDADNHGFFPGDTQLFFENFSVQKTSGVVIAKPIAWACVRAWAVAI
jgi:hypothetical protein